MFLTAPPQYSPLVFAPHSQFNSTFGNGANVGQLYENPEGGYYTILSREVVKAEDGSILKTVERVALYKDAGISSESKKYIGVDQYDEAIIKRDYKTKTSEVLKQQ